MFSKWLLTSLIRANTLDDAVRRVYSLHHFVQHAADLLDYALIRFVFRIDRQTCFPVAAKNDLAEWNPAQLLVLS